MRRHEAVRYGCDVAAVLVQEPANQCGELVDLGIRLLGIAIEFASDDTARFGSRGRRGGGGFFGSRRLFVGA